MFDENSEALDGRAAAKMQTNHKNLHNIFREQVK